MLRYLVDYLFPPRCHACAEFTAEQDGFCSSCFAQFNFITRPYCKICGSKFELNIAEDSLCGRCIATPPSYKLSRSLFKFDEHSKKSIHAFKYYDRTNLGKVFARLLCARYRSEIEGIDVVVPVPMNRFKRLFRMYNQAHVLAVEVARLLNSPVEPRALVKSRWTRPQTTLTKASRIRNLQGSIIAGGKDLVRQKKVLLVDDVLTTGTTVAECARQLKKAGAKEVYVITIAVT